MDGCAWRGAGEDEGLRRRVGLVGGVEVSALWQGWSKNGV